MNKLKTLKITPRYLNDYEAAHELLSKDRYLLDNDIYRENEWLEHAESGELDQYIAVLNNIDKIEDMDKFKEEYGFNDGDSKTRVASLYNEIFADRENFDTERERYVLNDNGNIAVDENGKYITEKYTASDYDYYKSVIRDTNKRNHELAVQAADMQRKESMNAFVRDWIATLGAVGTELAYNFTNQVDGLLNSLAAINSGLETMFNGGSLDEISDSMVKMNNSDTLRFFEQLGVQDWIIDFERRYTGMRNYDGSYTDVGKYLGGVAGALGQMIPAMLGGRLIGTFAKGMGLTSKAINISTKLASTTIFYQPMAANDIRDTYRDFSNKGISVPSGTIISNSVIKASVQALIEAGLDKVIGGSAIDKMVFGRDAGVIAASTLKHAGAKRLMHDFTKEGLEEVFQDTSDFLINGLYTVANENFGELTDITWQSLADAFIIGGLASFAGNARSIAFTQNIDSNDLMVNKEGEFVRDRNGKIKVKKLGKLGSWEYGLDMDSFIRNFTELENSGKKLSTSYNLYYDENGKLKFDRKTASTEANREFDSRTQEGKKFAAAYTEAYAAYRMLMSVYGTIGTERFNSANKILSVLTHKIQSGKFDAQTLQEAANAMNATLLAAGIEAKADLVEKLNKANITELDTVIHRDDDLSTLDESVRKEAEEIFAGDNNINTIVYTKDGDNLVFHDDMVFVEMNYAKNADGNMIFETHAEQLLVDRISHGSWRGNDILGKVLDRFKKVSGKEDANTEEAVWNLVFNDSFFRIMLSDANKDMYAFVSSLYDIEKSVNGNNRSEAIYKKKINTAINNMKVSLREYLVNQVNADYKLDMFTASEQRQIRAEQWCKNLYARVLDTKSFNKLSNDDWRILERRVNALQISDLEKSELIKKLHSDRINVRTNAMNRVASAYESIFFSEYDGKTYMPAVGYANGMFNEFLKKYNITIKTLSNKIADPVIAKIVDEKYDGNSFKYWQDTFSNMYNRNYSFDMSNGNIAIYEYNTLKQIGFAAYNANINNMLDGKGDNKLTNIERAEKKNYIVQTILNKNIDVATAAYLSIDQVINDPSLLSEQLQLNIEHEYGTVDPSTAFLYLRRYFIESLKDTTVIVLKDGSYAFGNIRPMTTLLKSKDTKITNNCSINKIIKSAYLYGRLSDVKIELVDPTIPKYNATKNTAYISKKIIAAAGGIKNIKVRFIDKKGLSYDIANKTLYIDRNMVNKNGGSARFNIEAIDDIVANYSASANTIFVDKLIAEKGGDYLNFALLHEFQHAIQSENAMNLGINCNWINSNRLSRTTKSKIIADVRKHRPELFKDVVKGGEAEAQIVNDFVYFSSGESTAYGMDASSKVDFYPTIVSYDKNGVHVSFPWGTRYNISGVAPMSIYMRNIEGQIVNLLNENKYYEFSDTSKNYDEDTGKLAKEIENDLLNNSNNLTEDIYDKMQNLLYSDLGLDKNSIYSSAVELPFIRVQFTANTENKTFDNMNSWNRVNANVNTFSKVYPVYCVTKDATDAIVYNIANMAIQNNKNINDVVLVVGTFTAGAMEAYLGGDYHETLLSSKYIDTHSKKYKINVDNWTPSGQLENIYGLIPIVNEIMMTLNDTVLQVTHSIIDKTDMNGNKIGNVSINKLENIKSITLPKLAPAYSNSVNINNFLARIKKFQNIENEARANKESVYDLLSSYDKSVYDHIDKDLLHTVTDDEIDNVINSLNMYLGKPFNKNYDTLIANKVSVMTSLSPQIINILQKHAYAQYNYSELGISFNEYLNTKIPVLRLQDTDHIFDDGTFVSCSVISSSTSDILSFYMGHALKNFTHDIENNIEPLLRDNNKALDYLFVDYVYGKDIIAAHNNSLNEVLVKTSALHDATANMISYEYDTTKNIGTDPTIDNVIIEYSGMLGNNAKGAVSFDNSKKLPGDDIFGKEDWWKKYEKLPYKKLPGDDIFGKEDWWKKYEKLPYKKLPGDDIFGKEDWWKKYEKLPYKKLPGDDIFGKEDWWKEYEKLSGDDPVIDLPDDVMSITLRDANNQIHELLETETYKKFYEEYNPNLKHDIKYIMPFGAGTKASQIYHELLDTVDGMSEYISETIGEVADNSRTKRKLKNAITPDVKDKMLHMMYYSLDIKESYNEFLTMDLPFIRIQNNVHSKNDAFLSASINVSADGIFNEVMNFIMLNDITDNRKPIKNINIVVGTFKPKECIGFLRTNNNEVLLNVNKINSSLKYKININNYKPESAPESIDAQSLTDTEKRFQKKLLADIIDIANTKKNISANEIIELLTPKYDMVDKDTLKKLINTVLTEKLKNKTEAKAKRKASKDPMQQLQRLLLESIRDMISKNPDITAEEIVENLMPKYKVIGKENLMNAAKNVLANRVSPFKKLDKLAEGKLKESTVSEPAYAKASKPKEKAKSRYVSQKSSAGTNLEKYGYAGKYKRNELSKELQTFIVNATEDIAPELWSKVAKGTIKTRDVMDYFRDTDNIDDKTFEVINKAYFRNSDIRTFDELMKYVDSTDEYFAIAKLVKKMKLNNVLVANSDVKLSDAFMIFVNKNSDLKKQYDKYVESFYRMKQRDKSYKDLIISKKNLRRLWMKYFDGSIGRASYVAAIARDAAIADWLITGESDSQVTAHLEEVTGDGITVGDTFSDAGSSEEAMLNMYYSASRQERIDQIIKVVGVKEKQKALAEGLSEFQSKMELAKKITIMQEMSDQQFEKQYKAVIGNMSAKDIESLYKKSVLLDAAGIDITKLSKAQIVRLNVVAENMYTNERTSAVVASNIYGLVRTIRRNVSDKQAKLFLKENSDIFDENLKLKDEVMHDINEKGKKVYTDIKKLLDLEKRVRDLSSLAQAGAYRTANDLKLKQSMQKKINALERKNKQLIELASGKKRVIERVYEFTMGSIGVEGDVEMPPALKRILSSEFNKTAKTNVKYLSDSNESHVQANMTEFIKNNAEYLHSLSQSDVEEIANYYINTNIIPDGTGLPRIYLAIQIYMLSFLSKGNDIGNFILSDDAVSKINDRLKGIISIAGVVPNAWHAAMKLLDPAEVIVQSLAKSADIEFSTGDINTLIAAVRTGNIGNIEKAKSQMYEHALQQYKGTKQAFLDKLFNFERLAMLSGPGTWIRNRVSNVLVTGGNRASERIGNSVAGVIEKLFPNKKWKRDNQYNITDTKVSSETHQFIKREIIDSGLLKLLRDGLNKYDVRKNNPSEVTADESMTDLLIESVKSAIFQDNTFKNKYITQAQSFILKMLSDDVDINKAAIRYLGKILTEDGTDLSEGLSVDVINHVAEAYRLAAYDYMHKPNVFNKIENQIRQQAGIGAYFMYKQIFPFAAASWNWFLEGLNYSPIGLAKAIINFAKLENTIDKLEDKRQRGEQVISNRFAQYIAKRNLGKGVIGSVGWIIGALLAGFGFAGIDDEDDKYKLFVKLGNDTVYVDISDVFGTQGIMLGITMISAFKGDNIVAAIGDTLDTMFLDSTFSDLFNSFRYNDTFGDWIADQPFSFLNMFIPNFIKTLSSIASGYKVKYSSGILGKIERLATSSIPGLVYAFPKYSDPYTGETQIPFKSWFITKLANKLLPMKIYPYNISDAEKEAIKLGIKKEALNGRYTVNKEKVNLNAKEIAEANSYYGKLNKHRLNSLINNKQAFSVLDKKKNEYVKLKYSQMTDEQKKTVIERIMNNNGQIAKIYILTSSSRYKYYANDEEYNLLKALHINNIYKKTSKYNEFVKN